MYEYFSASYRQKYNLHFQPFIGAVLVDANDRFIARFLNKIDCSGIESELPLKLARKTVDVFGSSVIEEGKIKHQVMIRVV